MKKQIFAASLAGLMLAAAPVFAHGKDEQKGMGGFMGLHLGWFENKNNSQFMVMGTISSIGSGNVVITSQSTFNVPNVSNSNVTVKTDSNTKVAQSNDKKTALKLSDLAVGEKVFVTGSVSGSDALAKTILVVEPKKSDKDNKALGKVTAIAGNSITVTNTVTGTTKVVTSDANTQVKIDGVTKSVSDIQVGDSGWVKFKTVGTTIIAKIFNLFR